MIIYVRDIIYLIVYDVNSLPVGNNVFHCVFVIIYRRRKESRVTQFLFKVDFNAIGWNSMLKYVLTARGDTLNNRLAILRKFVSSLDITVSRDAILK